MTSPLAAEMADLIIACHNIAICVYDYRQAIITHIAHQPPSPPQIGGTNAKLACVSPSAPPKLGAVGSPCQSGRAAQTPLFPPSLAGAAARTHPVRPPPMGAGSLQVGTNNKCPANYSSLQIPLMLGSPKAGAMADGAANAPASPPPTPKGVDFIMTQTTNAPPIIAPCKSPSCSGVPRQEQWRTVPPMPLPARPPPLKGWISSWRKRQMPRLL